MRVEVTKNGDTILCGVVLPDSMLQIGQRWLGSGGRSVYITAITTHKGTSWVCYEGVLQPTHEKDSFSFQCRYCLVLENIEHFERIKSQLLNEERS